jgi:hypothetical protein
VGGGENAGGIPNLGGNIFEILLLKGSTLWFCGIQKSEDNLPAVIARDGKGLLGFGPAGRATIQPGADYSNKVGMIAQNRRAAGRPLPSLVWLLFFAAIGLSATGSAELYAANLSARTVEAFNRYVEAAEARMQREEGHPGDFLYIETLPKAQYDSVMSSLKQGEVYTQQLDTRDTDGKPIDIPDGMIHHWVGDVFIPGKSLSSALKVLRDYDNFKNIYQPEIVRSRLIRREDPNDYKIYLRLQKASIVTVTLDTWYDIRFTPVGNNSGYSRSVATRIQQVEDAGTPREHLDPVGQGGGYLWRINSYWRYQQRDDGVVIEWESIALSRPIPFLIAWFVRPLVRRIAREAVQDMLTATRKAVLADTAHQAMAGNGPEASTPAPRSVTIVGAP